MECYLLPIPKGTSSRAKQSYDAQINKIGPPVGARRDPKNKIKTRMWANAQRDGCPVEYRWRPLFEAAKFG